MAGGRSWVLEVDPHDVAAAIASTRKQGRAAAGEPSGLPSCTVEFSHHRARGRSVRRKVAEVVRLGRATSTRRTARSLPTPVSLRTSDPASGTTRGSTDPSSEGVRAIRGRRSASLPRHAAREDRGRFPDRSTDVRRDRGLQPDALPPDRTTIRRRRCRVDLRPSAHACAPSARCVPWVSRPQEPTHLAARRRRPHGRRSQVPKRRVRGAGRSVAARQLAGRCGPKRLPARRDQ